MQVSSDDFVRPLGGVRNPTGQLFHVEPTAANPVQGEDLSSASAELIGIEGEPGRRLVTGLD